MFSTLWNLYELGCVLSFGLLLLSFLSFFLFHSLTLLSFYLLGFVVSCCVIACLCLSLCLEPFGFMAGS